MSYPSQCPRCPGAPACHRPAHWQGHHHSQFPLAADGQCRSIPPIQCWMVLHWCSLPKCLMTEAMTSQVHQLMTESSLEYFCKMTKWLYIDIDRFWLHRTVGSFWETPSTRNNAKTSLHLTHSSESWRKRRRVPFSPKASPQEFMMVQYFFSALHPRGFNNVAVRRSMYSDFYRLMRSPFFLTPPM